MAVADVSLKDTGGTVKLKPDGSYGITVPEGYYVEMKITFLENYGFVETCYRLGFSIYFEILDGLNQSADLLGVFCEIYAGKEYIFRSSGHHMWLRVHGSYFTILVMGDKFQIKYTAKHLNATGMFLFFSSWPYVV